MIPATAIDHRMVAYLLKALGGSIVLPPEEQVAMLGMSSNVEIFTYRDDKDNLIITVKE